MPVDEMRIGDFTQPVVAPKSPTEEALKSAEKRFDDAAQKDEAALKPMQSYEQKLADVGVTKAKAADIVDAVLLQGYYAEDIALTKSIKCRLRTRNARDTSRAQQMLEGQRLSYDIHYSEKLTRYLLAASLERFGKDKFEHPTRGTSPDDIEAMYKRRLDFVEDLSEPALRLLINKLVAFDRMIAVVFEEGSVENF